MATIDQDLIRPKTKVFRKVTIGVNTITLEAFGSEGAGFYPFAFYVIRVDRYGYTNVEGDFKTKAEAVECFKKTTAFYERFSDPL